MGSACASSWSWRAARTSVAPQSSSSGTWGRRWRRSSVRSRTTLRREGSIARAPSSGSRTFCSGAAASSCSSTTSRPSIGFYARSSDRPHGLPAPSVGSRCLPAAVEPVGALPLAPPCAGLELLCPPSVAKQLVLAPSATCRAALAAVEQLDVLESQIGWSDQVRKRRFLAKVDSLARAASFNRDVTRSVRVARAAEGTGGAGLLPSGGLAAAAEGRGPDGAGTASGSGSGSGGGDGSALCPHRGCRRVRRTRSRARRCAPRRRAVNLCARRLGARRRLRRRRHHARWRTLPRLLVCWRRREQRNDRIRAPPPRRARRPALCARRRCDARHRAGRKRRRARFGLGDALGLRSGRDVGGLPSRAQAGRHPRCLLLPVQRGRVRAASARRRHDQVGLHLRTWFASDAFGLEAPLAHVQSVPVLRQTLET